LSYERMGKSGRNDAQAASVCQGFCGAVGAPGGVAPAPGGAIFTPPVLGLCGFGT